MSSPRAEHGASHRWRSTRCITTLSGRRRHLYPVKANAFLYLKSCTKQFDVIFSDAPYDLEGSEQVVKLVLEGNLLRPEGIFIFEHSKKMDFSACEEFWQLRSYGSVQFSFFKKP